MKKFCLEVLICLVFSFGGQAPNCCDGNIGIFFMLIAYMLGFALLDFYGSNYNKL